MRQIRQADPVDEYRESFAPHFAEAGVPEATREGPNFLLWESRPESGDWADAIPGEHYQLIVRVGTDASLEFDPRWIDERGSDRLFAPMRFDFYPWAAQAVARFLADPSRGTATAIKQANGHPVAS